MELSGWTLVDEERAILWREYEFTNRAWATSLVFRGADGGLVVVSPGRGLERKDLDALSQFGEVKALVANNSFHHLGQKVWREHFKNAVSYAAPFAVERLNKKSDLSFRSIEQLALPEDVRWEQLPGSKTGELLLRLNGKAGRIWYTGDILTNIQRMPGPPMTWFFKLTGSAPGYRLFKPCIWAFVSDRKALKQRLESVLAEDPPAMIVPAHGPAVTGPQVAAETKRELDKL